MGTYVNPGTRNMEIDIDDEFYVDKSMIISLLNDKVESDDRFLCVSRPRRFGKTMAANMIAAYYSKGCDSHEIFSDLKISKDPTFEDNINRYTVIKLDINGAATGKGDKTIVQYYNENVVPELMKAYPNVGLSSDMSIAKALVSIHESTGDKFVFIIDEYDLPIRDGKYASELGEYIAFLVSLFKSEETNYTIALAYLTGIMPIIREKVQSKLNNFTEYTMLDADDMAPFMGFTEEEVRSLASKSGMAFDDLKRWYDGYSLKGEKIYSPKSIVDAVKHHECDGYWTQTSSYRALKDLILMDFEGIRKDIVSMISGSLVPVNVRKFTNTPWEIESRDDVFTCLIHLGYLGYDSEERSCFIPNYELMEEWISAIEDTPDYRSVVDLIRDSKALMEATWKGDEEIVAEAVARAHSEACSIQRYNNEGSFQSALHLAYYYAKSCYTIVNELPGGKGYADVAFIPYKPDVPAIIIELKKDDTTSAAISQIRERKYPEALEKYRDNLLLVAITYDSKTKEHRARIEKA